MQNTKNDDVVSIEYNTIGAPLRIHELDIASLANWLHEKKIRTTQGKLLQPLHEGHLDVLTDPGRFKVLACGRRWGKTLLTSLMAVAVLMQHNRRVCIVAPDYNLAEKVFREVYSILVTQLKIIIPGKQGRARNQRGDYFIQTPWGSILEAKSMENPDSLAGEANDLVIVDEAALNPKIEDIWMQMMRPTLMDKEGAAIFISTPRGKNSFYKLFLMGETGKKQRQGKIPVSFNSDSGVSNDMREWSSFQRTSYDNPLLSATPEKSKEEVDNAYRSAILSGKALKFKQEYLADFESVSDTCFPGFIEEISEHHPHANVVDYNWHPDEGPIYAACDHNFAKPASTLFAQLNQYGDLIIFDEKFTRHTTSYMQAQQILEKEQELNKTAWQIWNEEMQVMSARHTVKFENVVADIAGDQRQLNGRSAWDDFETVLGKRPVGLKQDRETGCNMLRLWMQYPKFDQKGRPILNEHQEPITFPKLFITANCINLRYALSTAVFQKTKNGALKEDYEASSEGYEGLLDALRYLVVFLFHDRGGHITVTNGF
jgi:hypothetical protein